MTLVQQLAGFVSEARGAQLSAAAREQLKIRIVDSLACAIGAVEGGPVRRIRSHVAEFSPAGRATLIGGGTAAPDLAALYNGALVRYLDFNDSYLAKGETCHPSDNFGAILAAAEYNERTGEDFLSALAVSYQVQCRLSDAAPVRAKGFDHTVQGAYAAAAAVSKALGLDPEQTANAIAISGTALNSLRVTRTGTLSHWKGLAMPFTAYGATVAAFLARRGITGPPEVFEGNKGFQDSIAGPFALDWAREDLERVTRTIIKRYNAEIHSQSTLEGVFELLNRHPIRPDQIARIEVETFDVAFHIIGGGEEGGKLDVRSKEEADHSLPYMIAVAILDGQVLPAQYETERILRRDVQELLRRVQVHPVEEFSYLFPERMACRVAIHMSDGQRYVIDKEDYEGFHTRPMRWETITQKFEKLAAPYTDATTQAALLEVIRELESHPIRDLTRLLAGVRIPVEH